MAGRNVFPGQRPELAVQAGLVALDGEDEVAAALVQVDGVLPLRVHRVCRDQDAVQVLDLIQQRAEHRDLVALAVHGDLGTDHAGAVVQAGHQVRRAVLARAGSAQGLAVHREHRRRLPACQPGRDPGSDDHVQRQRVHRGQHPPDSDQARDRAR